MEKYNFDPIPHHVKMMSDLNVMVMWIVADGMAASVRNSCKPLIVLMVLTIVGVGDHQHEDDRSPIELSERSSMVVSGAKK